MELFDKKFVYFLWEDKLEGKICFYEDNINDLKQSVNNNLKSFTSALSYSDVPSYPFRVTKDRWSWRFAYYDPDYDCKVAYEKGEKIQFRPKGDFTWVDCASPQWSEDYEYRIKPEAKYYIGIGILKSLAWDSYPTAFKHVYASVNSLQEVYDWIKTHKRFIPVMRAFERGLTIEYKDKGGDWQKASTPSWSLNLRYRVKPKASPLKGSQQKQAPSDCLMSCKDGDIVCFESKVMRRMTNRELAKWLAEGKGQLKFRDGDTTTNHFYCKGDNVFVPKGWMIRAWNENEWREPEVEE